MDYIIVYLVKNEKRQLIHNRYKNAIPLHARMIYLRLQALQTSDGENAISPGTKLTYLAMRGGATSCHEVDIPLMPRLVDLAMQE